MITHELIERIEGEDRWEAFQESAANDWHDIENDVRVALSFVAAKIGMTDAHFAPFDDE